jgi:hypothetical protein
MEDASVALDDADDLGLSYPRGFYAVRAAKRDCGAGPWALFSPALRGSGDALSAAPAPPAAPHAGV